MSSTLETVKSLLFSKKVEPKIKQEFELTARELKKRAEKGSVSAQLILAVSLKDGFMGLRIDRKEADEWLKIGKNSPCPSGLCAQALLCYSQGIDGDFSSPEWLDKIEKRVGELYKQALASPESNDSKHIPAMYQFALFALRDTDQKKLDIINIFASCGYPPAILYLAHRSHAEKDLSRAASLFLRAAELGSATAKYYLGYFYKCGKGVSQDTESAIIWFKSASEQGDRRAEDELKEHALKGHNKSNSYKSSK